MAKPLVVAGFRYGGYNQRPLARHVPYRCNLFEAKQLLYGEEEAFKVTTFSPPM
jgi:hypothetical protein